MLRSATHGNSKRAKVDDDPVAGMGADLVERLWRNDQSLVGDDCFERGSGLHGLKARRPVSELVVPQRSR